MRALTAGLRVSVLVAAKVTLRVGRPGRLEVRQRVGVGLDAGRAAGAVGRRGEPRPGRGARTPPSSSGRLAPPKRAWSAARIALRASTIDGLVGIEQERVEQQLDPAPVARALGHRHCARRRSGSAAPCRIDGNWRVVLRRERLAQLEVDRDPDLAVGVDLRAGQVVADVAEVQRVDLRVDARRRERAGEGEVRRVVADAAQLVAGHVGAGRERVLVVGGDEAGLVEALDREQVAEASPMAPAWKPTRR